MPEEPYEPEELGDDFFDNLIPENSGKGEKGKGRKIKVNFDDAKRQYANFCTLSARKGEAFLSFGQAFPPVKELKVDTQVAMSMQNAAQLHSALTKLLKQHGELPSE